MDLLKKIFIIFAMAATVMPAVAGDSDSIDSRKARREIVHKSIKDAVKGAKQLNTDSIRQQVAQVISDEFSDTLFEWEKSSDWDSGRSKTGIKAGKLMEELDGLGNGEAAVAIVIIFLIFGFPMVTLIVIIWIIAWFSTRKNRERNRVVAMSIERGIPLPPDYFRSTLAKSRLQSGLVWIMWGIGIAVFFLVLIGLKSAVALGLIPFLVGMAKLITYFVEDRPQKRD